MRMRATYALLLLAVITLLVSINAETLTTNKLQESRTETADRRFHNERFLREESNAVDTIATDDEERAGITTFFKNLLSKTSIWLKDKTLATKLHFKAMSKNLDKPVQKLVEKGIDPDRVYRVLKLHKSSNTNVGVYVSGEFLLWGKRTAAWKIKYPNWVSKIPK
ncbi:hypothetical protein P3T76_009554 [Phytophthora citrophthora]|uniref:RxLR effector protein n=1 Tax=Phytophthora citrophthora TaxID=4793 RepID=A0AAD9GG86_9STRA|nr:hypothetical protein P3T76_009554 [Phytophthora citrophthora]